MPTTRTDPHVGGSTPFLSSFRWFLFCFLPGSLGAALTALQGGVQLSFAAPTSLITASLINGLVVVLVKRRIIALTKMVTLQSTRQLAAGHELSLDRTD